MKQYPGECSCGKATLIIELPKLLREYTVRKCDCDFCQSNKLSYLSDCDGKLTINAMSKLKRNYQGSNQASFLSCPHCKMVIAVVIQLKKQLLGAVNISVLENKQELSQSITVSPKQLTPQQKVERWQSVWLKATLTESSH